MDGVGAKNRPTPAPRLHEPSRELFGWMVVLGLLAGLLFAIAQSARDAGQHGWAVLLWVIALLNCVGYFYAGMAWARLADED